MRGKCVQCQIWKAKCSECSFNPASQGFIPISLKVHVKIFTDFGGFYIRAWWLDLSGWILGTLLRSSSLVLGCHPLCAVLAFPPMGLPLTGVPSSAQVTSAQLLLLLFCLLELVLDLRPGKGPVLTMTIFVRWPFWASLFPCSWDISEFPLQFSVIRRSASHCNSVSG